MEIFFVLCIAVFSASGDVQIVESVDGNRLISGVAVDSQRNVYLSLETFNDYGASRSIRRVTATGVVSNVLDLDSHQSAQFLAIGMNDSVVMALSEQVAVLNPASGAVTVIAGIVGQQYTGDGLVATNLQLDLILRETCTWQILTAFTT